MAGLFDRAEGPIGRNNIAAPAGSGNRPVPALDRRRDIAADGKKRWRLSDIGILNDPSDLVMIALVLGSPGLLLGAIAGALAWRKRRWAGALLGAVIGFATWLVGWMWVKDLI
jgi:hypothetical protein